MIWWLLIPLFTSIYFHAGIVLPVQEGRSDLVLMPDPLLEWFPFRDTSLPVNLIQHGAHLSFVYAYFFESEVNHDLFHLTLTCYFFIRSFLLFVCPLRVHPDVFILRDPIQKWILGTEGDPWVHDLISSGHVSICWILSLNGPFLWKPWYWLASFMVGILMLMSKVHYTIDLVIAPFVAYGCYAIAQNLCSVLGCEEPERTICLSE